jgi:apolipoprotein N-acyltransferase
LAHPPFGVIPGLLGYALLLLVADAPTGRPGREAFLRGWLAGVGYFAIGVWWVAEAFLVDAKAHGWMAPFALILLSGGLALFWGLGVMAYRLTRARGVLRVLVFAGTLSLAEWLRGNVLTGFPWNLPGETWKAGSAISQTAAVAGVYGLTWITLVLAAAPAVLFDSTRRRTRFLAVALAAVSVAGLYGFGATRLAVAHTDAPGPLIRLVQANIDQKEKWRPENLEMVFSTYETLTRERKRTDVVPEVVIWPEGALPAVIDELLAPGSRYVRRFEDMLAPGQTLLLGANRMQPGANGEVDYFNSLIALRREPGSLRVTGVYDKHRLVPFGEFLPLGRIATRIGFRSLVHMPEDFAAGPPPRPLRPVGLPPLQPLICYEALFPRIAGEVAGGAGLRPEWILNVSNDAWFGETSGPLQHLNLASYRAIEEGLPMVRVTPTGVSAVIDAHGRTLPGARLGLSKIGVIDQPLPPPLKPTLYSRYGELGFAVMLLVSTVIALGFLVRRT